MSGARVSGRGDQDESMEDDGRPPGSSPGGSPSWAEKVQGSGGGGIPVPERLMEDEFVSSRMSLEFPDGEEGEAVVTIGQEVLEVMNGLYRQCLIVKVLGRHIPIAVMNRKLRELWKPEGGIAVLDLPRQFFMIRFDVESDFLAAVTGGPWKVFGSVLLVQAWSPTFDPSRDESETMPVWVRISNLPVNFYHRAILMGIGQGLGRAIRVDSTTLRVERAKFARVCVEINLKKPLKGTIVVNGGRYLVSYEGLANICPTCGVLGHLVGDCPKRNSTQLVHRTTHESGLSLTSGDLSLDGFKEVRRSGRKLGNAATKVVFKAGGSENTQVEEELAGAGPVIVGDMMVSNSFSGLAVEEVQEGSNEMTEEGEDKENENTINMAGQRYGAGSSSGKLKAGRLGFNQSGYRTGEFEKKAGGQKTVKSMGVKIKYGKGHSSTRGLVFGPLGGDSGGVVSGKRLRVEHGNIGRAGGTYTSAGTSPSRRPGELPLGEGMIELADSIPATASVSMGIALQKRSSDNGVACADK